MPKMKMLALTFHDVDDKPPASGDYFVITTTGYCTITCYSKKHDAFNVLDEMHTEEVDQYKLNVIRWAKIPTNYDNLWKGE